MSGEILPLEGCPTAPKLSAEQKGEKAAEILKAMGITTCSIDQASFSASANASILGLAKAGMQISGNSTSTVGCEQVVANVDSYNQAQQNIQCTINKATNKTVVNTRAGNSVEFTADKDLNVECPVLNITQNLNLTSLNTSQLNSELKDEIKKQTETLVKKTNNVIQDTKNGLGATGQGQRDISVSNTNIEQQDYSKIVNETLNELKIDTDAQNNIKLKSGGNLTIKGNSCIIDQNLLLKVITENILTNAFTKSFDNISKIINESDKKTSQKADNRGADDLAKAGLGDETSWTTYLIWGLVILFVVIAIGAAIYFVSRDANPEVIKAVNPYSGIPM